MSKDAKTTEEIYAEAVPNMLELTAGINQIAAGVVGVNSYAVRNELVLAQKKRKILYKNGRTLPASAQVLMAEAKRDIDHSAKLGRNMRVANPGMKRPSESDAHHIVSAQCREAEKSRQFIFKLGIGINDFDNGVILPRFKSAKIPSMPNAIPHQHIHTIKYHMSVFFELFSKEEHTEPMARMTLQAIGGELVVGTFPYI